MEPWYKVVTPRKEVREGRSFNPDEFAIALEQVVAGTAPEDYKLPKQFFARTCFTRALREHAGMTLRRLAGKTENAAPVMALITQFGGGKTHTLTALYHLAKSPSESAKNDGVAALLSEAQLDEIPKTRVAVFVGNSWDPSDGNETPWIDVARQLAGEEGIRALGPEARSKVPGTTNIQKLFDAAGGSALVLCDEVLNYLSRHRDRAEAFKDFLANLVRSMTGTTRCAAMISLPQSKPEMSDWDLRWQDLISKEVSRVAKQLIVNDESEISEVVRRRLFEDLGSERVRRGVAKAYADWAFERRAQLPPAWMAVDTTATEKKARELLQSRFEGCYPFHPATLSVFQQKWQALPQYQQTRGTLAMLAQWVSWAYRESFTQARSEPLITLGSAPLEVPEFRGIVLSQLGEPRLLAAIEADIAGANSHARALDADTSGTLRNIHRRVGTTVLFESTGGQSDKVAHLPELRFALCEPDLDTTSIDTATITLETKAFFIRKIGSDGFQIRYQPTLKKVVNDRRASLDEESEIKPTMRNLVQKEFERGASIPLIKLPKDGTEIQDSPRLALVMMDPILEWTGEGKIREQIAEWTKQRGKSPRLYPGSLVWCLRKPGRDLRDKVEHLLAWRRVQREIAEGVLGTDFDRADRTEIQAMVSDAEEAAKDEVWAGYRFILISDGQEADGLKVIDLGAGHSSSTETLCGRVIAALKAEGLLSESVGATYIDRHWPPAFVESGAWPLTSLRQSFLNGMLTRLLDPDAILRGKLAELVSRGDFGLGSGPKPDGTYERVWYKELLPPDEITFETGIVLLKKARAEALKKGVAPTPQPKPGAGPEPGPAPSPEPEPGPAPTPTPEPQTKTIRLSGTLPPELWNRLGTKILPKLKAGADLSVGVDFSVVVKSEAAKSLETELRQILDDLGLTGRFRIE
jgi:hypothetical protein